MPHALVQILGDPVKAWKLFDKTIPRSVQRTALIDTFWDEKTEAIKAFETLGPRLWGVRMDTPSSRRGDFRKIIEEVRWELDIRGGREVKILVSGRLSEENIVQLKDIVDGFGIGTAVSYPPSIDFSAKIVEVQEKDKRHFRAKRGGLGGRKAVFRSKGFNDCVVLEGAVQPKGSTALLKPLIKDGKIVSGFTDADTIRRQVMKAVRSVNESEPSLGWNR
jgi:nicotinate phosphoribosyltransferase